jgi:prepilin-type N-terminal cleavage/methylation domain-containing protein
MRTRGFTVIELIVVITALAIGGWVFYTEKITVDATVRDSVRKVAINAMYYSLEEVYYEKNKSYPAAIDSKTLRAVDPGLFTDPTGVKLDEAASDYRYEANGCDTAGKCTGYTLRSTMERESDYVKTNRNK